MKILKSIGIICLSGMIVLSSCDNNKTEKQSKENSSENSNKEQSESKSGEGRYGIKSGMITSETMLPNNMGKTTVVQQFDDYGKLEKSKTTQVVSVMNQNTTSESYSIMRDNTIYNWSEGSTTGTKVNLDNQLDVSKLNYRKLSDDLKKQFNIQELGKENILGKNCDVYGIDYMGAKGKIYVWNGITMKSDMTMAGMHVTINVISLDENVSLSSDLFEPPSNITFTEVKMPIGR